MTTRHDHTRPTDDVQDAKLLEDIDPGLAEAAEVHGGQQMQDSFSSFARI